MMRKGKIAARILTAAIALSMLGQNVATVYAEETAIVLDDESKKTGETDVDTDKDVEPQQNDSEKKDDAEQGESKKTEEETPKPEDETKKDEGETPEPEDDTKKDENKDEESDASKDTDKKEDESENKDESEKMSDAVKAFLDAVNAFEFDSEAELTEEEQDALDEQVDQIDALYKALTEDEQKRDDVTEAYKAYQALFGTNEIMTLDETDDETTGKTIYVGGDTEGAYDTLQAAIDAAQAGDTVKLEKDVTTGSVEIKQPITLDLNEKTITASGTGSVLKVNVQNVTAEDSVTIKNGTITGGDATANKGRGGAISIAAAKTADKTPIKVTLDGLTLKGNHATKGGAVNISQGNVTISNCEITNNDTSYARSSADGGAIYANDGNTGMVASLTIKDSTISYNTAQNNGGAISTSFDTTIIDCTLNGNVANASNGGAIDYASINSHPSTKLIIKGTTISKNTAAAGGAIASGSTAALYSGKKTGYTSTVVIEEGSVISENIATNGTNGGGAVYLRGNGTRFEMSGGSIKDNHATNGNGGAIYSGNYGGLTITGGSITGNDADNGNGGAIYIENTTLDRYADIADEILNISGNTMITGNSAKNGGGVYITKTSTPSTGVNVSITDKAGIYNNDAKTAGDDIYVDGNTHVMNLIAANQMGGDLILDDDNKKITDWYYDGYKNGETTNRYSKKGYYEIYTPVSGDSTHVALKAAHYETKTLDADMLIDDNDTEHTAVPNVIIGSSHSIIGQINVKTINDQINAIGAQYDEQLYDRIQLSDVNFQFTAVLEAPEGVTLPSDLSKATVNIAGFEVDTNKSSISGQTATVYFKAKADDTTTYAKLKALVNKAAEGDALLSITIPDVKIDKDAALEQKTFVGTVEGEFSATASLGPVSKKFAFGWETKQSNDGRDYTVKDDASQEAKDKIQLTVNVVALGVAYDANGGTNAPTDDGNYAVGDTVTVMRAATRSGYRFTGWLYNGTTYQPGDTFTMPDENVTLVAQWSRIPDDDDDDDDDDEPTPVPAHTDDHPLPQQVQTISEAGAVEAPVQEIVETGEVTEQPAVIEESGHISATGDDSLMNVYGAAAAAAAGILALWFVKRRRHA